MADEAKIKRLTEIQEQINALIAEGVEIADEEQVTFSLGSTPFAAAYGMGGYRYVPSNSEEAKEREKCEWYPEYQISGWLSSSSECN